MKHYRTVLATAVVLFAMAMPSISAAQYYHEEKLDRFISQRPELKKQLERNPNLIYNKEWRERHPDLREFMQNHPQTWGKLPGHDRWGAYGPDNGWHEADWWHDHDRDWFYRHHPEWAENHPEWRDDGDWDDQHHEWHDRDWRNDHHPDWVERYHPNWYKHQQHEAAKEEKFENKHEHENVETTQTIESKHEHHGNNGNHGNKGGHGKGGND